MLEYKLKRLSLIFLRSSPIKYAVVPSDKKVIIPLIIKAKDIKIRIDDIDSEKPRKEIKSFRSWLSPNSDWLDWGFAESIDCNKGNNIKIPIPSRNEDMIPKIYMIYILNPKYDWKIFI